jgi:alpha-L-glutamate ligase-like protein
MAVSKLMLGMNARNYNYIRKYNRIKAKQIADDKVLTKQLLVQKHIPTPRMYKLFKDHREARSYDWETLPESFVIKPAHGYGGEGIVVIEKWNGEVGRTVSGVPFSILDLESHIFEILDGTYSLDNLPDEAMIEERVIIHPFFKKLTSKGLPDLRVIVFNKVPVMAMLRLPTEQSGGTANLHRGALGIGIDMRTGITTHALYKNKNVAFFPGTRTKIRGLKIPEWDDVLMVAARGQHASKMGFAGVDIVFDEKKGAQILEMNARPGLSIQLANRASLRTRLERIEHVDVVSVERGVELAKTLFAEPKLMKVKEKTNVLHYIEKVALAGEGKKIVRYAKLDTGAYRTAIDKKLVKKLGLKPLKRRIMVKSANGVQFRKAVHLTVRLGGKEIDTLATYVDRGHLNYPIIIGRRDLRGFLIDPTPQPHHVTGKTIK